MWTAPIAMGLLVTVLFTDIMPFTEHRALSSRTVAALCAAVLFRSARNGTFNSYLTDELEKSMNDETFNLSIRKFLKMVGVNSQREIEQAVAKAMAANAISGTESFPAKVTLEIAGLQLNVNFDGEINLQ